MRFDETGVCQYRPSDEIGVMEVMKLILADRRYWNASLARPDCFCRFFCCKLARGIGEANCRSEMSENGNS
jgi:hypothetical protein